MTDSNPKRMLVFVAHPDKELTALSGILAKYAGQGVQIVLLCATCSEARSLGVVPAITGELDEPEFQRTARSLGIEVYSLGYSNDKLAAVEPCMLLETITCWIDQVNPQLIITVGPEAAAKHPDEAILSRIVTQAYDECCQKGLLLYAEPIDKTQADILFTVARGTQATKNYPDWFEPELEQRQISDGKA